MRIIQTEVYTFSELSEKAKQKAISKYREALDFYDESIKEDAESISKLLGITDFKLCYSGFYSQGDGASFTGSFNPENVDVNGLLGYAPIDKELKRIVDILSNAKTKYIITRTSSRYCHANTMQIEPDEQESDEYNEDDNAIILEALRDFAQWIYRTLEKDDDYIKDEIEANGYEFTSEGAMV